MAPARYGSAPTLLRRIITYSRAPSAPQISLPSERSGHVPFARDFSEININTSGLFSALLRLFKRNSVSPYGEVAMEYRRCTPPCARYIANDDPHSKCVKCLGFSHAREAVIGSSKCKFCENLLLKTLKSRLAVFERESFVSPPSRSRGLSRIRDLGFGCRA